MMFAKLYLIALPIFFILDMLWLGIIAKNFYAKQVGFLMKSDITWVAAIIFYLLFTAGLVYFVIIPGYNQINWYKIILSALLFGIVTYSTYDLTNLATLKNWPIIITIIDLIWGGTLSVLVTIFTTLVANKIGI